MSHDDPSRNRATAQPAVVSASCGCTAPIMLDAGRVVCGACRAPIVSAAPVALRPFSQRAGERPAGCGGAKYLRAWRRGRDAGDPECWAEGRARLMTPGAWARHGARAPAPRKVPAAPVRSVDADVAAELGITLVQPSRRSA